MIIKTTNGYKVKVDKEDYEWLSQYSWYAIPEKRSRNKRIADHHTKINGNRRMHRLIMNAQKGITVDHINGDTLDNRKQNLRLCSLRENNLNKPKTKKKCTSKYKGVSLIKTNNKWYASIMFRHKSYNLGQFKTEKEAARAYDKKAKEFFGKFANVNFKESEG